MNREPSENFIGNGVAALMSAHSVALIGHTQDIQPREGVHSAKVLHCRAACYPVMVPDINADIVAETEMRKSASRILHESNPGIFKK